MTIIKLFPENKSVRQPTISTNDSQVVDVPVRLTNSSETESESLQYEREIWGEPHNGWSNYETWSVYFSIAGEDAIYRHWMREADKERERLALRGQHRDFCSPIARRLFFQLLNAYYATPLVSKFGVHSELLMVALGKVNWQQLATTLRDASAKTCDDVPPPLPPNSLTDGRTRFSMGGVKASRGVLEILSKKELVDAVIRHQRGDWGNVDAALRQANEAGVDKDCRLVSAYETKDHVEYWIITDDDRAATNVLLPSEY